MTELDPTVNVTGKETVKTSVDTAKNRYEYHKAYRKKNAKTLAIKKREYTLRIKNEGIDHYGGKCTCCGEDIREFLTLEHRNGRNPENKRITGRKMWAKARSEGYPKDYTVLCFNCNCAKGAFGKCPHELTEKEI